MMSNTERYAIQIMHHYAARPAAFLLSSDLMKELQFTTSSLPYIAKVCSQLTKAGYLHAKRGVGGGHQLQRRDVTLAMVLNVFGDTVDRLRQCPLHPGTPRAGHCCPLGESQAAYLAFLQNTKFMQLAQLPKENDHVTL